MFWCSKEQYACDAACWYKLGSCMAALQGFEDWYAFEYLEDTRYVSLDSINVVGYTGIYSYSNTGIYWGVRSCTQLRFTTATLPCCLRIDITVTIRAHVASIMHLRHLWWNDQYSEKHLAFEKVHQAKQGGRTTSLHSASALAVQTFRQTRVPTCWSPVLPF